MMHITDRLWAACMFIMNMVTLSPFRDTIGSQSTLKIPSHVSLDLLGGKGPRFRPPGGSIDPEKPFECNYTQMVGWESCSTPSDRGCWLRRISDGKRYDINTNYEDDMPIGVTRNYELELTDSWYVADGMNFTLAKLFDDLYPGPWIQACWGDTVVVNVTNKLQYNGTSVHWHGIRQYQTMHMDGVNGITQCPIAPDDYFVYNFTAIQYGSSWYHSHYSVQYADGAVGPLTIHGPTSDNWDKAISPPLIMTDWGHNSAFEAVHTRKVLYEDILLNGRGNVTKFDNSVLNTTPIDAPFNITFEGATVENSIKKYLLRIINTSFDRTFVFSIDNHNLTVVSADFVPIQPYNTSSVLVGIGQRYNVIVEANPLNYNDGTPLPTDGNYWIRTYVSTCFGKRPPSIGYERTGILRYNSSSTDTFPSSYPWPDVSKTCLDEDYSLLRPVLPWNVSKFPTDNYTGKEGDEFNVWVDSKAPKPFPLASWTIGDDEPFAPLQVNYSDPTFFHLDNTGGWDKLLRMVIVDGTSKDWIYLAIKGKGGSTFGAHPIHLHGHDFAILEQAYNKTFSKNTLDLKYDNPPRRDVVLLPINGYIVIAFKADNPGAWLVHCHIAFHISEGLGMQIMENRAAANAIWPKGDSRALDEAERVCTNWNTWYNKTSNWAVPPEKCDHKTRVDWCFQDDSGV